MIEPNRNLKVHFIPQEVENKQVPYIKYLVYGVLSIALFDLMLGAAEAIMEVKLNLELNTFNYNMSVNFIESIALLFIISYYLKRVKTSFYELFFRNINTGVYWLIAAIVTVFAMRFLFFLVDEEMLKVLPTFRLEEYYVSMLSSISSSEDRVYAFLSLGIATGFSEEVFLRGFCYNLLRKKTSIVNAILFNIIIFLLFHPIPAFFVSMILFNIIICIYYEKSKSLMIPVIMHITFNSIAVFVH